MQENKVLVTKQEIKDAIVNRVVRENKPKPITGFNLWQTLNQNSWNSIHTINRRMVK